MANAYEQALTCVTLPAAGDLSADQYRFVKVTSDGEVELAGDGDAAFGVLQNDPDAAGKAATVAVAGITKVRCSATVAAGVAVGSAANGLAAPATSAEIILGTMIVDGANGTIGAMHFHPRGAA